LKQCPAAVYPGQYRHLIEKGRLSWRPLSFIRHAEETDLLVQD
jgi:hypothetical protein